MTPRPHDPQCSPPSPQYGLYSSFVGCFVYCFLGTARDVTLGPTAILSLLVSSYTLREPGHAVLLAFLSGCVQLALRGLCLGEAPALPPGAAGGGGTARGAAVLALGSQLRHLSAGAPCPPHGEIRIF